MIHKITDWSLVIRISQNYKLEPWDQDITKLQIGTMGSGDHKITYWDHVINVSQTTDWSHMIRVSQNLQIGTIRSVYSKIHKQIHIERSQEENHSKLQR